MKNIFEDLKQATFKQILLMSFPYLVVGIPGFLIFGTLAHYYPYSNWFFWLFWAFLTIALYPMIRNLVGAVINLFKK